MQTIQKRTQLTKIVVVDLIDTRVTFCHICIAVRNSHSSPCRLIVMILENLVLSKELIRSNYHRERFRKLTFRALAIRPDGRLTLETSGFLISHSF